MTNPATPTPAPGTAHPAERAVATATIRVGQLTPLHVHEGDEAYRVVEGAITVHIDGSEARLQAGEELTAPGGVPHAVAGTSPVSRYVVAAQAPSVEHYADFQRAVAVPDELPVAQSEDDAVVEVLAAASGITVLGPPGTLVLA